MNRLDNAIAVNGTEKVNPGSYLSSHNTRLNQWSKTGKCKIQKN